MRTKEQIFEAALNAREIRKKENEELRIRKLEWNKKRVEKVFPDAVQLNDGSFLIGKEKYKVYNKGAIEPVRLINVNSRWPFIDYFKPIMDMANLADEWELIEKLEQQKREKENKSILRKIKNFIWS